MRIDIKTAIRNPFNDLKCLIVITHALTSIGTPRMLKANLEYVADKFGFKLIPKVKP
jgi:hypothetical protein